MPLKTETIDLRDERERLDERLDDLAAREADVNLRIEALDDDPDDIDDQAAVALVRERNEIQQEAAETQTHLAGVAWAIDAFGERVATDGGTDVDASDDEQRENLAKAREEMEVDADASDDGAAVTAEPTPEEIPQSGFDVGNANAGTTATIGGTSRTATPTTTDSEPDPAPEDPDPAGDLTVTFGGLTAGEYARVADLADASNRQQIGFSQGGQSDQGATRNILVAAGTVDAPYFEGSMDLTQQANAVGDCSVNYVEWCESRIMDLTSPPESVGNGYAARVQKIMDAKRTETDSTGNPT